MVQVSTDEIRGEIEEKKAQKACPNLGDLRFYECPVSYITDETRELMRLAYLVEESKVLLYSGGWAEQPYWLIEAYEILKTETIRHLQKQKEENGVRR